MPVNNVMLSSKHVRGTLSSIIIKSSQNEEVTRTVELVGSIFTVEIAIADPLAGNTDAVVLTLESVVLAKDRGAVELVGIVAAVVGSVADAAQRNAGKAVLTGELSLAVYRARYAEMNETLRRIVGRTLGYVAAEFVGRVGTVR